MTNLQLYDKVRTVPDTAKKAISGGRLNGKTDINPMWRIKVLTEQFGVCGVGWKYKIVDERLEKGANDEIAAFVDIDLFIKVNGEWSDAIPGTGGSMFVAKEKAGLYTSDECYKMALTDALSVACKALGVGADVYFGADASKYDRPAITGDKPATTPATTPANRPMPAHMMTDEQYQKLVQLCDTDDMKANLKRLYTAKGYTKAREIRTEDYLQILNELEGTGLPFDI